MVIDIIDLNEYPDLNAVQLAMVRAAQSQKNALQGVGEEKKGKIFRNLLLHNVARSSYYENECAAIDAETAKKIDVVRDDLLYQIAYEELQSTGNEYGPYRYPENPNYNLSYSQRFLVVRNYYMNLYADAQTRLTAYFMDTLAREYLGEYYQTLYDLLASYV